MIPLDEDGLMLNRLAPLGPKPWATKKRTKAPKRRACRAGFATPQATAVWNRLCGVSVCSLALPVLCVGFLAAGSLGAGAKAACITAPVRIGRLALPNGHTISVGVGEPVYVELVAPEKYSSPFPWLTPASSDSHVLKRVPLCATTKLRPSTLSLGISVFRALRAGTASITAPLAPAWRALKPSRRRG